jgi:hypothetical protein
MSRRRAGRRDARRCARAAMTAGRRGECASEPPSGLLRGVRRDEADRPGDCVGERGGRKRHAE